MGLAILLHFHIPLQLLRVMQKVQNEAIQTSSVSHAEFHLYSAKPLLVIP